MASIKVFIDGEQGTTGLRIAQRLSTRGELSILTLPQERRKDAAARREAIHSADITFLCLPDDAAREAVALAGGSRARIIDASTAHRVLPDWRYGMPELSAQQARCIASGDRVAVPGCHASGFVALIYPLIQRGFLAADSLLSCFSVTGYSGGGKQMIAQYEAPQRENVLQSPRQYALGQTHKHLAEMREITGLRQSPLFSPIVADFYAGMLVSVPLHGSLLRRCAGVDELRKFYRDYYAQSKLIQVCELAQYAADGFLAADALAGADDMQLFVSGEQDRILLNARLDNLGKGASGAAIQCMNLMLGLPETAGLVIKERTK